VSQSPSSPNDHHSAVPDEVVPGVRAIGAVRAPIGPLEVARYLPSPSRRSVGPVVFFDHIGPVSLGPSEAIDVPPHPHIGLSTLTWLFEGSLTHRDSTGAEQVIRPGEVNWMTAGRGVVHSERSPSEARGVAQRFHGVQLWVGMPVSHEEDAPSFEHHGRGALPVVKGPGVVSTIVAGQAFGVASPVKVLSPMALVESRLAGHAALELVEPYPELGLFIAEGALELGGRHLAAGTFVTLDSGERPHLVAAGPEGALVIQLAGAPLDGPRYLRWNFCSSRKDRLEQASEDWRSGRFPAVEGDTGQPVPLPGRG